MTKAKNPAKTHAKAATAAGKTVKGAGSGKAGKTAAASALSQTPGKGSTGSKTTGSKPASAAGTTVKSGKASKTEKTAAASALAQAPHKEKAPGKKALTEAAKVLGDKNSTKAERSKAAGTLARAGSHGAK
ncbi:hypothetical protein [Streptomyces sp. NBC_01190]|uniref:hypothetical protein n=1 Tax=Streptomyces sp. NBC_01190 TaxID=2903767 RepID=UPI0038694656|nr:hypothetical protein OG519_33310 [Streptomyces sp. NBC_01190]